MAKFDSTFRKLCAIGQVFIAVNGLNVENKSRYLVTLVFTRYAEIRNQITLKLNADEFFLS